MRKLNRKADRMDEDADAGPDRAAVARMCIVTRRVLAVSGLIRFVAGPDQVLVPDIRNRLPGRGVWVTNSRDVLRKAVARKAFPRALKQTVAVPPDLEALVADLLRKDALQMLSLANKAGAVTSGFAKIEGIKASLLALVQASDGSQAEIARLQRLSRGKARGKRDPVVVRAFAAHELGLSIGREHVIHAALTVHEAASVFLDRALRFVEFQADSPAKPQQALASGLSGVSEFSPQNEAGSEGGEVPPRDAAGGTTDLS